MEKKYVGIVYMNDRNWAVGEEHPEDPRTKAEIKEILLSAKVDGITLDDGVDREKSLNTFCVYTGGWGFTVIDEFPNEAEALEFYTENEKDCFDIQLFSSEEVEKIINDENKLAEKDSWDE